MTGQLVEGFSVSISGSCAVIHVTRGENKMNLEYIAGFHEALDIVENSEVVKSLVTIGTGRFYCNGIDLPWLIQQPPATSKRFINELNKLFVRILEFPLPTIAAINGHCYAGGALLAFCHDYRVMQTKKGWFCFPEIKLKLTFVVPGMNSLMKACIKDPKVLREAVLFGKHYTAEEALASGIVDKTSSSETLLSTAVSLAVETTGEIGFDRDTLQVLKQGLYCDIIKGFDPISTDSLTGRKAAANLHKAKL